MPISNNSNLPTIAHEVPLVEEDCIKETYDFETEYISLVEAVKEYIEADCHAVVLDGEVLYNTYQKLFYRQSILEYVIREQLMNDPHRHLFAPLFRQQKNFTIEIFMFKTDSWKIVIQFDHQTKQFSVKKME